jgi:hypothetical protein|tara:strand:- start:4846 stop:5544 length:699 start_codon:yes stop_codon:yes gene_type:complete
MYPYPKIDNNILILTGIVILLLLLRKTNEDFTNTKNTNHSHKIMHKIMWMLQKSKNMVAPSVVDKEPNHIGILVKRSTPVTQKINKILAYTKKYGCDVVTVLRKHTDAIIMAAKDDKRFPDDIPCETIRTMLEQLFDQQVSSSKMDQAFEDNVRLKLEKFFGVILDYSEDKSEAATIELMELMKTAPITASDISGLAIDLLDLFEADYCRDGKITIDQLKELSNDMFDLLCN